MHDSGLTVWIDGRPHVRYNGRLLPLPRGGDGPDETPDEETPPGAEAEQAPVEDEAPEPDAIPDVPENIGDVDESELRDLYALLQTNRDARRETASTMADMDALRQIVDRQNVIAAEIQRRRDEAREVADALTALDETLPVSLPDPEPATVAGNAGAAQIAAARGAQTPAVQAPAPPAPAKPRVVMLAAAGTIVPEGNEMTWEQLGQAFDRLKGQTGDGDTVLASLPGWEWMLSHGQDAGVPELLSARNGPERNTELIREAQEDWRRANLPEAKVAAMGPARQGAICQPFDIIRDIPDAFDTSHPVEDIFPSRPVGRLGFQFVPSIGLSSVASGVSLWDEAVNQAAVDPTNQATWKPCVTVTCPTAQSMQAQAVTACLTFDNTTEMAAPERVRNFTNALAALEARVKEGRLLQKIDSLSISWQFFGDYGALPAIVEAVNTATAQLRFADRLQENTYVLIIPPAVTEILAIDRANKAYGTQMDTGDVLAYIRDNCENVTSVVETLDSSLGGEPGVPFNALPGNAGPRVTLPYISGGEYRLRLVDPSAAIYGDTGEINVGITRDSNLLRQNRAQYFAEEYFMLDKNGPQRWATIDVKLCADGSRAGLVDPAGCTHS